MPPFRQFPLLPIALVLIAGMVLGHYVHLHWGIWGGVMLTGIVLSRRWEGCLLVAGFALGAWLSPQYSRSGMLPDLDSTSPYLIQSVIEDVEYREYRTQLTLRLLMGVSFQDGSEQIEWLNSQRAQWRIYHDQGLPGSRYETYLPGDTLILQCGLELPAGQRNPNGFDYRYYLWARGVELLIAEPVIVLASTRPESINLGRALARTRQNITIRFQEWLGQPQAGLALGLLLGDKSGIDDDFRNRINLLGIGHILAVSGLHVGYVVLVLMALARLVPFNRKYRAVVIGAGLLGYVLLTGAPPSVVRASIMAFLYAWGRSIERRPNSWNLLGAAAVISLLIHPRSLFTVSFQLSFTAVAGILYVYPRFHTWLYDTSAGKWIHRRHYLRYPVDLFLVGLGAQLGILPVTLAVFHAVSVYVLLANLVVIPLAGLAVIAELAALLAGVVWVGLGAVFADAAWLFLTGIQGAVDLFSRLPQPQLVVGRPGLMAMIVLIAGILAFPYLFRPGRPRYRLRWSAAVLIVINLLVWRFALSSRELRITVLDVGQGDAIHLALPDGRHILVDAGMRSALFDNGERVVAPYLQGQGVGQLDAAVISHPHDDHLGGLLYLLEHLRIDEIWDTPNSYELDIYDRLKAIADSLEIPIRQLATGQVIQLGTVNVFVMSPDSLQLALARDANNASLVLKVQYGSTSLLLTGDIQQEVEARLQIYGDFLQSDWLKVAHHGSGTSSSELFLLACNPEGAVVSAGEGNIYGHPSEDVIARLEQIASVVHRTDEDGALVLRSNGRQWRVVEWQ